MPFVIALIALMAPRVVVFLLWFLTHWFEGVFETHLWPILGFFFAPTTLLWYASVHHFFDGQWGTLQIAVLVITVMIDLSPSTRKKEK